MTGDHNFVIADLDLGVDTGIANALRARGWGSGTRPLVVGVGGTVRSGSSSEAALRFALASAEAAGAETICFAAEDLLLPHYDPAVHEHTAKRSRLVEAFRRADGLVVASPGYHGAISGLVKNALDYAEDLAGDQRVYFSGLPVGCIGVAYGAQAANGVVSNLRTIVHALRGLPTPYGASIVVSAANYAHGVWTDPATRESLALVGTQVAALAAALRAPAHQRGA